MLKCVPWDKCWMNVWLIPLMRRDTLAKKYVLCLAQNTICHANVRFLVFWENRTVDHKRRDQTVRVRACGADPLVHSDLVSLVRPVRPLLFFRSESGEAHHDTPTFRMAHRAIPDWIICPRFWSLSQRPYTLIDCCWRCIPRIYMRIQIWKHGCQCF